MVQMNKVSASATRAPSANLVASYAIPITLIVTVLIGLICGIVWIVKINSETVATELITYECAPVSYQSLTVEEMICRDKQSLNG